MGTITRCKWITVKTELGWVWVGPLSPAEVCEVEAVSEFFGNEFERPPIFVGCADTLTCSYDNLMKEAKSQGWQAEGVVDSHG